MGFDFPLVKRNWCHRIKAYQSGAWPDIAIIEKWPQIGSKMKNLVPWTAFSKIQTSILYFDSVAQIETKRSFILPTLEVSCDLFSTDYPNVPHPLSDLTAVKNRRYFEIPYSNPCWKLIAILTYCQKNYRTGLRNLAMATLSTCSITKRDLPRWCGETSFSGKSRKTPGMLN